MTFENWLKAVDVCFINATAMDRDSWPDQDYWNMYDSGMTPMEATIAAIENEYGEEALEAFGLAVE